MADDQFLARDDAVSRHADDGSAMIEMRIQIQDRLASAIPVIARRPGTHS
jgi:hypothetical protein